MPDGGATQIADAVVVTLGRLTAGACTDVHLNVAVGTGVDDTLESSVVRALQYGIAERTKQSAHEGE